jgi:hypothetical protein
VWSKEPVNNGHHAYLMLAAIASAPATSSPTSAVEHIVRGADQERRFSRTRITS